MQRISAAKPPLQMWPVRRVKELESENSRLKRMYAELMVHHALKDAVEKAMEARACHDRRTWGKRSSGL